MMACPLGGGGIEPDEGRGVEALEVDNRSGQFGGSVIMYISTLPEPDRPQLVEKRIRVRSGLALADPLIEYQREGMNRCLSG